MKYYTPFYKILTIFIIITVKLKNSVLANFTNTLPSVLANNNQSLDSSAFNCPPGTFHTPQPYNEDCTKYIVCSNGRGNIENCAPGTAFDERRLLCDDINKVKCDKNHNDTLKACRTDQNYQKDIYSFSPTKYTLCLGGKIFTLNCNPEEFYSISRNACLPKRFVPQNDRVPEVLNRADDKIYCPNDFFGIFPYPFSNQKYIKCVYGELIMKQCRPNTVYNHLTKLCEEHVKDTETQNVHQTGANQTFFVCPYYLNDNFLHPFDCTKYIVCSSQATQIKSCLYNHIYSIQSKQCLRKSQIRAYDHVECKEGSEIDQFDNDNSDYLGVFCSVNSVGISYPHPRNWHKYVVCENNIPRVMMCPYKQVFDIETRKCQTNLE